MQAASDIFLGWTKGVQEGRFYYWRQLRDMKGSALIELFDPEAMNYYERDYDAFVQAIRSGKLEATEGV
jgi:hypothetical protein